MAVTILSTTLAFLILLLNDRRIRGDHGNTLPHDHMSELMKLLPKEQVERIQAILSEREATGRPQLF